MPLPLPDLDTRSWADLVEEARAMIPRSAPRWTDHNVHDPGITLIELLAWLVEQDVYQLNRVPDTHRRKFLALVGITPAPPQAATALLALAPPAEVDVPAGVTFNVTTAEGTTLPFRTVESLHAVPAVLRAILVQTAPDPAPPQDYTRHWVEEGGFAAFGDDPHPGAALWLGFDAPLPPNQPVRLAFALSGGHSGADERRRLLAEAAAQEAACRRPLPPLPPCAPRPDHSVPAPTLPDPLQHHSIRLTWQFYGASGWTDLAAPAVRDDTRALTLDGSVTLRLPAALTLLDAGSGGPARYYLRARLVSGAYDSPPQVASVTLNAARLEQAVPRQMVYTIQTGATITGTPPTTPSQARLKLAFDGAGQISALEFVAGGHDRVPEVGVLYYQAPDPTTDGAIVLDLLVLGRSSNTPGQRFQLPMPQVAGQSLDLYTLEPPGGPLADQQWHPWHERLALDASDGRSPHILLDETTGEIIFGNGDQGRIPPEGALIVARYHATAAGAGTLRAGQPLTIAPTLRNWLLFDPADFGAAVTALGLWALLDADPLSVWGQQHAAHYAATVGSLGADVAGTVATFHPLGAGAAAETLTHAAGRAVLALQAPTRAITVADYETLALATPGTSIARAKAWPGHHPAYPCFAAPGIVTVIIVPDARNSQPQPSAGLLEAVRRYLGRRRLLGTQVRVVGPQYVVVQVQAQVQTLPRASRERVRADVIAALNAFLHPLSGGPAAIQVAAPTTPAPSSTSTASPPPGVTLLAPTATPPPAIPPPPPIPPGWPFGRDVYRSEILQVLDGVAGVDHVLRLDLIGNGGAAQCGNLCVGPLELVVAGTHTIEVL